MSLQYIYIFSLSMKGNKKLNQEGLDYHLWLMGDSSTDIRKSLKNCNA